MAIHRYTECRLQSVASAMLLADLEAATVDWVPNFDASMVRWLCIWCCTVYCCMLDQMGVWCSALKAWRPDWWRSTLQHCRTTLLNAVAG